MSKEMRNMFVTQTGLTGVAATTAIDKLDFLEIPLTDARLRNGYVRFVCECNELRWDGNQEYEFVVGVHDDGDTSTAYLPIWRLDIHEDMLGEAVSGTADYKSGKVSLGVWLPLDELRADTDAVVLYAGIDVTGSNTTGNFKIYIGSTGE